MTDRGPNTTTTGGKIFPSPNYVPRIGHFKLNEDGTIVKLNEILFKDPFGNNISGRPNPEGKGSTGEVPYDINNNLLDFDDYGLDSEGLVALKDGTFWVSDEYGPHIVHFDSNGTQIERISPVGVDTGDNKLPAVFSRRWANRGMEGLAITPDEKTLVGIMQSSLYNPTKADVATFTMTRIVTYDIETGDTKQYLYKQEADKNSNSEIVALSSTTFLVIERDGAFSGNGDLVQKQVYKIDISNATDVSGSDFYNTDGMLVNGKTLEQNTWNEIADAGIKAVSKQLAVDLTTALGDYPHDKLEGLWVINGNTLGVINDDDFAVWTGENNEVVQKTLPPNTNSNTIDGNTLYIVKF